ncbi:uncharacterized protein LOC131300765 isoform X2 [Rhododendron vialii]|uniref:uncharacterized protein LOC131300765 isoform X2 n=1 Tax=Rhododendron vialii TaxID=182163 RepID=UPI00265E7091|nr:uncharacterized protein LOC131300765 isoform X2 [Rhododendron vialii]
MADPFNPLCPSDRWSLSTHFPFSLSNLCHHMHYRFYLLRSRVLLQTTIRCQNFYFRLIMDLIHPEKLPFDFEVERRMVLWISSRVVQTTSPNSIAEWSC